MFNKEFEKELQELINKHSIENESDTPDWILTEYIINCLKSFKYAVRKRDKWFSYKPWKDNTCV